MPNRASNTQDLMQLLREGALGQVLCSERLLPDFPVHLAELCNERGEARERIIQRAGIERSYGHQLFNGTRRPSRDKAIQLAFGFGLDLEQTQTLLEVANVGQLSPRIKRDAIILYCLLHQLELREAQNLLESFDLQLLGR